MAKPQEVYEKWIRAFRKVYPEWDIDSLRTRCPKCSKIYDPARKIGSNYCWQHHWAYEKWLGKIGVAMLSIKDPKLNEEVKREGLL